jgi:hypothetical protein
LQTTFLLHFSINAKAQDSQHPFFNKITMAVDTHVYHFQEHSKLIASKKTLVFEYFSDNQQVELNLFPSLPFPNDFDFQLLPATSYEVLEDPILINNSFFRVKLKFKQLSESELLKISYQVKQNSEETHYEIPLFPTHRTIATLHLINDDIYLGEEKKLEIAVNTPENVLTDIEWNKTSDYEYKIFIAGNHDRFIQNNFEEEFILKNKRLESFIKNQLGLNKNEIFAINFDHDQKTIAEANQCNSANNMTG